MIANTLHAPLLSRNTFGIEATARELIEYDSVADLQSLAPLESQFIHIGSGSNLLFAGDCDTTLLHSRIHGIEVTGETADSVSVRVGAAVVWDDFVAWAVASRLAGVENLSLIPGETGSAAVQNIGAYGAEAKDVIESVETVDMHSGEIRHFSNTECGYGYRRSVFKRPDMKHYVITHVNMSLSRSFKPQLNYGGLREAIALLTTSPSLSDMRHAVISLRQSKLPEPAKLGNAGSFFTNPVVDADTAARLTGLYPDMPHYPAGDNLVKLSAGWLIEHAGWKGRAIGRAGVYERQALVLVNLGGATGADVIAVARAVIAAVSEKFGVTLVPEVNIIGESI